MTWREAIRNPTWQRLARRLYVLSIASVVVAFFTGVLFARTSQQSDPSPGSIGTKALAYMLTPPLNAGDDVAIRAALADVRKGTALDVILTDHASGAVVATTLAPGVTLSGPPFGPPLLHASITTTTGRTIDATAQVQAPRPSRFFGFIGLMLAALAVASVLFAAFLAAPLAGLARVAHTFGQGDLGARVDARKAGPFAPLATTFNEMAERVRAGVRAERELLANVSHELRTPLSRIRVALELADTADAAAARESLGEIATDLAELEHIIDDVLTAARLDSRLREKGALPLHTAPANAAVVDDLLKASAAKFEAAYRDRPLRVDIDVASLPALDVDANLLRRAVDNVLDNAGKYSTAGESVELSAGVWAGALTIAVADHGAGMDDGDRANLFTPFFRGDKSRNKKINGVGLGLVLVKRIVEAHKGTIDVDSKLGAGTTVTLRIPITPTITTS